MPIAGLPDFSCFKFFIFQCFKPVTSRVVQEWDPPTTTTHLQTPTLASSSALHTVASCTGADKRRAVFSQPEIGDQILIQWRQYRQSTSKSIVKLNYKIQYPRNSGSKKQSRSYFLRFFFKNSSSKYQKRFAIGGYTTMFFAANCSVSFHEGYADDSLEIAKFIGKCAENVIA